MHKYKICRLKRSYIIFYYYKVVPCTNPGIIGRFRFILIEWMRTWENTISKILHYGHHLDLVVSTTLSFPVPREGPLVSDGWP